MNDERRQYNDDFEYFVPLKDEYHHRHFNNSSDSEGSIDVTIVIIIIFIMVISIIQFNQLS